MKKFYELFFISIIFVAICFLYRGQQRLTVNGGKGWDGIFYYNLTEQIKAGANPVVGDLPFIKRLGTPFLIAEFSNFTGLNILDSALYVNLIGTYIIVVLLFLWLKLFLDEFWITGLLCFLFMMAWYLPLRFSFYYPLTSDAWGAAWFLAGLLLFNSMRESHIQKRNTSFIIYTVFFSVVVAAGSLFREANTVLCLLPFFILDPFKNIRIRQGNLRISDGLRALKKILNLFLVWETFFLLLPVVLIIVVNILIGKIIIVTQTIGYSYIQNILTWFYQKTLPEYLLGIFTAYGPLVVLIPFFYKNFKSVLRERQELLLLLILSLLFGLIGGTDTERILFMSGFPVVLVIMGISIKNIFSSQQKWWLYILLVLQTISFRFFWTLPDYTDKKFHTAFPFFGIMKNQFQYHSLYSHFSNSILSTILLAEYFMLFVATWYVLHNKVVLRTGSAAKNISN